MKKTNKLDKYSIIIFQIENLQMNLFWALLTQFLPITITIQDISNQ